MLKLTLSIVYFLLLSCESNIQPKIIYVNKTQKVESKEQWETAEKLRFLWSPPEGPQNSQTNWIINDDILLFTPNVSGEYYISLTVEDQGGKILNEEKFYFLAINPDTVSNSLKENLIKKTNSSESENLKDLKYSNSTKKIPKSNDQIKISKEKKKSTIKINNLYTIQIGAWPKLEEAYNMQRLMQNHGFDSYTQKTFIKDKDEIWWRLRVGKFTQLDKAKKVKFEIENLIGEPVWIDMFKN